MRKQRRHISKWLSSYLLISIVVSGCSAFQIDITPPPAENQDDQIAASPLPTQKPAQTASQSAAALSPDDLGSEVIVVNVIDHTGGVLLEQGLEVELAGYEDYELVYEDKKTLISVNQIVFEDAPFLESRIYFASISHGGATYRSEIVELGAESTSLGLTINIYETTTSDENLIIDRVNLIVDFPTPEYIQIIEIYIMSNLGDYTVVAPNPGKATVYFPLPADAEFIEFENGEIGQRYIQTENGFGDTVSVPPGSGDYQVLVSYKLPIRGNRISFSQEMPYPVQAVIVMIPAGEAEVEGSNLEDRGIQAIPDGSVQIYSGGALARGESLDFRLFIESGTNTMAADGAGFLSQGVLIGLGVIGGVVLVVGAWLILRQHREKMGLGGDSDLAGAREQILDSIIALEDRYQEGDVKEEDYFNKRQELKDRLMALESGKE